MSAEPTVAGAGRPVTPGQGRLRPLAVGEVQITGGFWGQRQQVNASATLAHCLAWMDRLGWTGNFRAAAEGRLPADRAGREFSDSEVYKLAEAVAWEHARSGGTPVEAALADLTAAVAASQEPDGYLNTNFGRPGQAPRYSNLEWGHELYCYGHLLQAGVAHARAGADGRVLETAVRAADHVCRVFGPDGDQRLCGHPGIEMALVELARLTGEERYLDQAARFVDRRGHGRLARGIAHGRAYYQDDVPVRQARVLRGHAVRALYLASGAVDVAVETGDGELLDAVVAQWEATVARRTYLTGGMGARHQGEAFGDDFELPPDRSYSETCAGVASVMLAWRLLLATGEPRFADLAERTLFNVVAASTAPDGRAFSYANTLHQRRRPEPPATDEPSPRAAAGLRAPWRTVSCCPTNVARTIASLGAYVATVDDGGLQLHQYTDARIRTTLGDGRAVGVTVTTAYPATGQVTVRVTETPPSPWTLSLRVPTWAGAARLVEPDGHDRTVTPGTAGVTRRFEVGDVIRLELPVEPRWTLPDARIDAVRGTVAVEQGPLVLCLESPDLPDGHDVGEFTVDPGVQPTRGNGRTLATGVLTTPPERPWPYAPDSGSPDPGSAAASVPAAAPDRPPAPVEVPLTPYHAWANRGPSTMRVWLPTLERGGHEQGDQEQGDQERRTGER